MVCQRAFISHFIEEKQNQGFYELGCLVAGVFLLSILAQISIALPFTPVPITGQTFGVALVSLLWGSKRGSLCFASYLLLGALGAPVFAAGKSGLILGPTTGYLFGMLAASLVIGGLADRGWAETFKKAWLACFIGSVITFSFGIGILSFFVPTKALLMSGLIPFLPGDFIKSTLAASIASSVCRKNRGVKS